MALTYDGGVYVLNGDTLDLEADLPLAGFNRLNTAGDGRHVLVTTTEGFQVLDTGTWTDASGAAQTADPALTDLVFTAPAAGHVVKHGDKTILVITHRSHTLEHCDRVFRVNHVHLLEATTARAG